VCACALLLACHNILLFYRVKSSRDLKFLSNTPAKVATSDVSGAVLERGTAAMLTVLTPGCSTVLLPLQVAYCLFHQFQPKL